MKECLSLISYRCDFCNNSIGNCEELTSYRIEKCDINGINIGETKNMDISKGISKTI